MKRNRDRRSGAVLIWMLIFLSVMFSIVSLVFSAGQSYLLRDQLQIAADSASRAAVRFIRTGRTQLEARNIAQQVAQGTEALEGPVFVGPADITFGDYNHENDTFTPNGTRYGPAVQVTARRNNSSADGALDLLFPPLQGNTQVQMDVRATASTGCREVVFAIDVSEGMEQEIDEVYGLVRGFVDTMRFSSLSGDKVGMVVYAGAAVSGQDYAEDGGAFWFGSTPEELARLPGDNSDIQDWLNAMVSEGSYCKKKNQRLATEGRGSCLGKGDHHGINKAIEMFEETAGTCAGEGEKLIVMITSDTPCFWPGWIIRDPLHFYGGSFFQAYASADRAFNAGISIAPVLVDRGRNGNCPFGGFHVFQHQDSPIAFVNNMARGMFDQGIINPTQSRINSLLTDLDGEISVRLVD